MNDGIIGNMKLIFRTLIVLLLPFLTTSTADISNTKGLGLDFQDFVDIKDETTTLQFDFDREFYFASFYYPIIDRIQLQL